MAKQLGPIFIVGTFDGLCYYKSRGKYYVRQSNPLSSKQVKNDEKFSGTMRESRLFGNASRIASFVYKGLPEIYRERWMYDAYMGEASVLLRAGKTVEETKMILWNSYAEVWVHKEACSLPGVTGNAHNVRFLKRKKDATVLKTATHSKCGIRKYSSKYEEINIISLMMTMPSSQYKVRRRRIRRKTLLPSPRGLPI